MPARPCWGAARVLAWETTTQSAADGPVCWLWPGARDVSPDTNPACRLSCAACLRPRKDRPAGERQRPQSSPYRPTSPSACLETRPAWRTAAAAPDGLWRETAPPARPVGAGEKLSFVHRNFAAFRLLAISAISAQPAFWPNAAANS